MATRVPRPDPDRLRRLIDLALPGGRVVSVRRLRGGIAAYVHAVGVALPDGARTRVVLRRGGAGQHLGTAAAAIVEFRTLRALAEAGVPAPRPLLLDAEGRYFGEPALLTSYDGRPLVEPRDPGVWLGDLADALARLEAVRPEQFDLSFLRPPGAAELPRLVERPLAESIARDPLALAISATLRRHAPAIGPSGPCLVHRDFWPGNTVWRRGRLAAIVDWSTAALGDPRIDLAQCRLDLAMMHGPELAEAFLAAYLARRGGPVADVWFFDLLLGLYDALGSFRTWLRGYHDLGLRHIDEALMERRLRAFLESALGRAP
jgi:aminoglycoside phosphotransferase (APT) family kinase protein